MFFQKHDEWDILSCLNLSLWILRWETIVPGIVTCEHTKQYITGTQIWRTEIIAVIKM
jgi:hypothetical protein